MSAPTIAQRRQGRVRPRDGLAQRRLLVAVVGVERLYHQRRVRIPACNHTCTGVSSGITRIATKKHS